jgi:preprotein translocase subunit SecY
MPYISASIIMQLLAIVSPQLEALKKEGQAGQRKITQYTRVFTVVLATFQAFGIAVALENQPALVIDPGMVFRLTTVVTLVTGTMFLMWLGEQITERGLGNGISIIILAFRSLFSAVSQRVSRMRLVVSLNWFAPAR